MALIGISVDGTIVSAGSTQTVSAGGTLSLMGYCAISGNSIDSGGVTFSANNDYVSVTDFSNPSSGLTTATLVAGEANGTSTITVTSVNDPTLSTYFYVQVTGGTASVSDVVVKYNNSPVTSVSMVVGQTISLTAVVELSDGTADSAGVTWGRVSGAGYTLSNKTTSSVTVTADTAGSYTLYAFSESSSSDYAAITIVITESSDDDPVVSSVVLKAIDDDGTVLDASIDNNGSITISVGDVVTFTPTVLMSDGSADSGGVTWGYSAASTFTVSLSSGSLVVTATAAGSGGYVRARSKTDTSIQCKCNIVVTESSEPTVSHISITQSGVSGNITSGQVIDIPADGNVILTAAPYLSDGQQDSNGLSWSLDSRETLITLSPFTDTLGALIMAGSDGGETTYPVRCSSVSDPNVYVDIYFRVTLSEITEIVVLADDNELTATTWTMEYGQYTNFTAYPLMDGAIDSNGVTWELNGSGFTLSGETTESAVVTAGNSAATGALTITSVTDSNVSVVITLVIEAGEDVVVDHVELRIKGNDTVIGSGSTITMDSGETITLEGLAIMSDGSEDPDGVRWSLSSSETTVSIVSSDTVYCEIQASTEEGISSYALYCRSRTDSTIYTRVYFEVIGTAAAPEQEAAYAAFISDGSGGWEEYVAYVYTGSGWIEYNPDVYPFMPEYSITDVGADYGFELTDDGYYTSTNEGVHNSASVCALNVTAFGGYRMYLDCINYAEEGYDYGILSETGSTLSVDNDIDSSGVFFSFSDSNSASVQSIDYGVLEHGTHTIYIKYRKDASVSRNNDSLKFAVRFESE